MKRLHSCLYGKYEAITSTDFYWLVLVFYYSLLIKERGKRESMIRDSELNESSYFAKIKLVTEIHA